MNAGSESFLEWLADWQAGLPSLGLEAVASDPATVAVVSVDMLKGFCCQGALASPRAAGIIPAVIDVFQRAHDLGIRHFLLLQDTHDPNAVEFSAFPAHSVAGTEESEMIDELEALSFSDLFTVMPKNSVSCDLGTDLGPWLDAHSQVITYITVGVCTDICIHQLAMYLRTRANVLGLRDARVIVPADCVQTYDVSVQTATELDILPHDGDLLHRVFLYSLALNDVEVVASLT